MGVNRLYGFPSLYYPEDMRIDEWVISRPAGRYPGREAVVYAEPRFPHLLPDSISYGELDGLVQRLAAALQSIGLARGSRVAVFMPNMPEVIVTYHAVWRAGGVVVPVNPLYKEHELEYLLSDSEAEAIVVYEPLYPIVKAVQSAGRARLGKVIILGREEPPGTTNYAKLLQAGDPQRYSDPGVDPKEDPAVIIYTGGTTGPPKGAVLTHYNLVANTIQLAVAAHLSMYDVWVSAMPLFHSAEFTASNTLLSQGAKYVVMGRFDPELFARNVEAYRATITWLVPTALLVLLDHLERSERSYDWSRLKYFLTGAWPVSEAAVEKLLRLAREKCNNPRLRHNQVYGMTEIGPMGTTNPLIRPDKSVTQGIPLPDIDIKIVDLGTGEEIREPGKVGEIVISGPNVFKGYWKRPEENKRAWWTDPETGKRYFRTGDLGYFDEEGFLHYHDRVKEVIKYKGYTIAPAEIEALLVKHPAVLECAVIGKPDPIAGEIPKAYIVLKPEYRGKVTEKEIIDWVAERISPIKRVREVEFVDEIPKTASGKILRRILREREQRKLREQKEA